MYKNISELFSITEKEKVPLWNPILKSEAKLQNKTEDEIISMFSQRLEIMRNSAKKALNCPQKTVGNLITAVSLNQWKYSCEKSTICGQLINRVMAYALSCIEVNASMGRICAAPTAGSCGILPAVLFGLEEKLLLNEKDIILALVTAAGLGAVVTQNASVSGAEGGCQAECGTAAAISLAAAVQLMNGTPFQSINAFKISLINISGLVCDPVAGLVQIPCAQRNASQAVNALLSADLALGGMTLPFSADEVINVIFKIGKELPRSLKETALGGLAVCPTALKIKNEIFS